MDYQAFMTGTRTFVEAATPTVSVMAAFAGLLCFVSCGRMMFNQHDGAGRGEDRVGSKVAMRAFIGALLLQFQTTMTWMIDLLFGAPATSVSSVVAYSGGGSGGSNFWNDVLQICMLWVTLLGWLAAFRGLMAFNTASTGGPSSGNSGDLFWKGVWHLVGGALCVNIAGLVKMFQS